MKRFSLLIGALVFWCFAQCAEQGDPTPEVHPDGRVTFTLKAPKVKTVELTAEFLADGPVPMVKGEDGVWSYTTPEPLPSELYLYTFLVDSMRCCDPVNVYMRRDGDWLFNYFIVPGERGNLYRAQKVPHGTITKAWYHSDKLDMDRRMTIYTPTGYEDNNNNYPVLYLLHGMGGDEDAWCDLARANHIFDNMIANGDMQPMIVVMPNDNVVEEAAPGISSAEYVRPIYELPKTMDGSFEVTFDEIIQYVESHFRVKTEKKSRAIAGLSMGGFHAMHISKLNPDMFDYVGLFSSSMKPRVSSEVYDNFEEKLDAQFEDAPKLYWIAIGQKDRLYQANKEYRELLDRKGYKYTYYESEGAHTWRNWRIYLTMFVKELFK